MADRKRFSNPILPGEGIEINGLFMLILLFGGGVFAASSPDLSPPFYVTTKGRIGYWLISDPSIIREDLIILVPPIQHRWGHAWCTLPLPPGEWSIDFTLSITEGTGGGGFAIWLIDQFAMTGPFYGGPSSFSGVAVTGAVFANDNGSTYLNLDIVQSKKTETHRPFNETHLPMASFSLSRDPFTLRIRVSPDFIRVSRVFSTDLVIPLTSANLTVNLGNAWIGISAVSDMFTSRIDLRSAKFDSLNFLDFTSTNAIQKALHQPRIETPRTVYRHPCFELMTAEIGNLTSEDREKTAAEVLAVVREFADVVPDVATFGQLNRFVKRSLETFVVGWHRRTFKMMERAAATRAVFWAAFNQTQALVELFNSSVYQMVNKTETKIVRLSDFLENDKSGRVVVGEIAETATWMVAIECVTVAEILAVAAFYVMQTVPSFRQRFLER
jgi:hypothetical protein